MRLILPFMLMLVGCVATLPGDDGLTADIACETARLVVQMRQQIPPTPAPPSDGKCRNCDGRGFVGDGNGIRMKCQLCDGTGNAKR